eukprot:5095048-Alexandrium_andersonii.AAC.1
MSASLVGSEMCIRDRGGRAPPAPQAARRAPRANGWALLAVEPAPSPETVSYTHLTLPTICSV